MNIFYNRLKDIREDRDLTQAQVSAILGILQTNYSKYELGKNMMGIDKYQILARFYNVSIDYLCGLVNTPRTLDGTPYSITNKNITINNKGDNNKINIKN